MLAESNNSSTGCTQFNITVTDCVIKAKSNATIYLIQTKEDEQDLAFNDNSAITINSGIFNGNPQSFEYKNSLNQDIIVYSNEPIVENVDGTFMFVVK